MKIFDKLYSKTSTGATHTWQIFVSGNSYWTESGQLDGVITRSKPTVCFGKNIGKANETTPEQQALKDAESKYKKQLKLDYHLDVGSIHTERFIQPMLAKSYKDRKGKQGWPLLLQLKYNGGRCVATKDGLFTRKGERYLAVPHIENSLKSFFADNEDAVLDGELFNEDLRQELNKIMKLIRRTVNLEQEHFNESKDKIKFYVYDGYNFAENTGPKVPYRDRKAKLDEVVSKIDYLEVVPTFEVNNEDEMNVHYAEYLEQGHEGIILRIPNSPYENKRSANLLKHKPVEDAEFLITDIREGTGDWAGCAKIIGLQMDDGREFNGTFKGTMEEASGCLRDKDKYIGKRYTMQFFGLTGFGVPNYCQWKFSNSTEESEK